MSEYRKVNWYNEELDKFYDTDKDGKLNMNEFRHFAEDSYEIAMMLESWKEPERIDAPWKCVEVKETD